MNWNLMLQVATTIILKLIASSLFLMYFPQIFYTPIQQEDPSAITKASCAARWHPFEGKCYFFSTAAQTWAESQETCRKFRSLLAVVNSEKKLTFLKSRASYGKYFIGLTHRDGRWTWIDGTEFDRNIFNLKLGRGDCIVVGFDGFVDPAYCYVSHHFICEKNA